MMIAMNLLMVRSKHIEPRALSSVVTARHVDYHIDIIWKLFVGHEATINQNFAGRL